MTDLRPTAERTLEGLLCLLYPADAGHDLIVYVAPDAASLGEFGGAFAYGARIEGGKVRAEVTPDDTTHTLSARGQARALAWARRELR